MPYFPSRIFAISLSFVALGSIFPGPASARPADVTLTCANGATYHLRPRAVTVDGDLVTGYLLRTSTKTHHMRLIPMGDGYRYAGLGIWLDGVRESAVLNFGPDRATACQVSTN